MRIEIGQRFDVVVQREQVHMVPLKRRLVHLVPYIPFRFHKSMGNGGGGECPFLPELQDETGSSMRRPGRGDEKIFASRNTFMAGLCGLEECGQTRDCFLRQPIGFQKVLYLRLGIFFNGRCARYAGSRTHHAIKQSRLVSDGTIFFLWDGYCSHVSMIPVDSALSNEKPVQSITGDMGDLVRS